MELTISDSSCYEVNKFHVLMHIYNINPLLHVSAVDRRNAYIELHVQVVGLVK